MRESVVVVDRQHWLNDGPTSEADPPPSSVDTEPTAPLPADEAEAPTAPASDDNSSHQHPTIGVDLIYASSSPSYASSPLSPTSPIAHALLARHGPAVPLPLSALAPDSAVQARPASPCSLSSPLASSPAVPAQPHAHFQAAPTKVKLSFRDFMLRTKKQCKEMEIELSKDVQG